jgi:predicted  nucleic acid-binding Zn-ribbon protein
MVDKALARLDGALAQLEAAARRRIEAERGRANLETELALMQDDRARLAAELDGATARLGDVETAAADVDQRLQRAMNVIGAVIERARVDAKAQTADEAGDGDEDAQPGPACREPAPAGAGGRDD